MLDAWAAQTCAVKTWYAHSPQIARPAADESLREAFHGGASFVDQLLAALIDAQTGGGLEVLDLRPETSGHSDSAAAAEATGAAMEQGVPLIIGGLLPLDPIGHRSGRPDLLVRGADTIEGRPGYHPVLIKRRRIAEKRRPATSSTAAPPEILVSRLDRPLPAAATAITSRTLRVDRDGHLIQLGHYWRMLQAAGVAAAGPPLAGLIGTDHHPAAEVPDDASATTAGICWVDLDRPLIRTFSRSSASGWRLRSVLERQDHEHAFRVLVAENARTGDKPVVQPIRNPHCDSCAWWQLCEPRLGADDISVRIDRTPLDVREISVLRGLGVRTVSELAEVEIEQLLPDYLPEVRHREGAERRLRIAHRRARLIRSGVALERITTGSIEVPSAPVEIDLDIEVSAADHVYLWGFWVHDRRTGTSPHYVEFSAWQELDAAAEEALAARAMSWLKSLVDEAGEVCVFHYSPYEVNRVDRLAERSTDPMLHWARAYTTDWCDLYTVVRDNFFGTRGLGLKVVATLGAGFRWRDEDPGGLNSQIWHAEACDSPDLGTRIAARQRVLAYNEDDVRATWQLRRWLRSQ